MQKTFCALAGISAITASLSSGPILADTEFEDSIPINLARSLLRGVGSPMDIKIYSDIPSDFPAIEVPDGATLMGSVDQGHNKQVVLFSDGEGLEQQSELIESLQNAGYLLIDRSSVRMPQTGFVSANPPDLRIPVQLCHDLQGLIHIQLYPETDRTFINITTSPASNSGGYTCAARVAQNSRGAGFTPFLGGPPGTQSLQSSLPRLTLPEEAAAHTARFPALMSSSSGQAESKIDFSVDWSLSDVYAFFSDQVAKQDWMPDTETSGNRVALGAWTREENNRILLGTLRVVSKVDDNYQAEFAVSHLE